MPSFILTAKAEEDLTNIWLYVAEDNPNAADRILDNIEEKFKLLMDNPYIGPARPDIAPHLRYYLVDKYLILYRIMQKNVEIVRVIHGSRHLINLL